MQSRLQFDPVQFGPVLKAMIGLEAPVAASGLEPALLELIKVRVSQLNGCGYCIDMHTQDARAAGETEQRLYVLSAWHEAPFYTARERAALKWAEAVTRLEHQRVDDEIYAEAKRVFDDQELVALTLAVVEINGWNRFAISFQFEPGTYRPAQRRSA